MKEAFFFRGCCGCCCCCCEDSSELEDVDVVAAGMATVVTPPPFVAVTNMVASSSFFCSSPLEKLSSSKLFRLLLPLTRYILSMICSFVDKNPVDSLSKFVVLFFLYLMAWRDLALLVVFLMASRKLRLFDTFADGFADKRCCWCVDETGVDEYLSCSL